MSLTVGEDGALPLPWLAEPLAAALASQRGHALLVHGAAGVGALQFAITLAQAWLCESSGEEARRPCGRCGSCRLFGARLHPDLHLLMPETLRRSHDWPLREDKLDSEEGKRKPSRQIRIDDVRSLIDWVNKTSARGRGKAALLHPAEALNLQSASALLKTLEEPPPGTRLLLTTADPALLLPTVRSRCQHLRLPPPATSVAAVWLAARGVAQPETMLAACSGRPLDALALVQAGVDAQAWSALPVAVARGQAGGLSGWPVPLVLDALQKLCHDVQARAHGSAPSYFVASAMPAGDADPAALAAWARELARVARNAEHPWNEALLLEALVGQGRHALAPAGRTHAPGGRALDTLKP